MSRQEILTIGRCKEEDEEFEGDDDVFGVSLSDLLLLLVVVKRLLLEGVLYLVTDELKFAYDLVELTKESYWRASSSASISSH
jgi:hypothetical protein